MDTRETRVDSKQAEKFFRGGRTVFVLGRSEQPRHIAGVYERGYAVSNRKYTTLADGVTASGERRGQVSYWVHPRF